MARTPPSFRRSPLLLHRRRWVVAFACAIALLLAAPAAADNYARYVENTTFYAGVALDAAWNQRGFNSTLFDNIYGGLPQMGVTYCDTTGSCYAYMWSNTGWLFDERNIAYGKSWCKANSGNNYWVFVQFCDTGYP